MKKIFAIAALLVATLTASAQNDDLKNEVGLYSALGREFGGPFRGFVELGFGERGMLTAGVRYKF